jgi:hypothetical protein
MGVTASIAGEELEEGLSEFEVFFVASNHQARTCPCAFKSTACAAVKETNPTLFELAMSSDAIAEVRVTAVNNQVARFQVSDKTLTKSATTENRLINGLTRGQHEPNDSRAFQSIDKLFQRVSSECSFLHHCVSF